MTVLRPLSDDELSPEAAAVFADIRETRGTDFVNNIWRSMAHDPALLASTWSRLKTVMVEGRDGGLDPLTKELIYLAVSITNNCEYCAHTHTAAARAKGMTDTQYGDFLDVIAMAAQTNALATAFQTPVDDIFLAD